MDKKQFEYLNYFVRHCAKCLVTFPWIVGNKRVCYFGGGKRHVNDDVSPLRVINRCLTDSYSNEYYSEVV